jgi:hypothetical protein
MSLRPACEHLLILENSPLPGLYDAQRRTWLRWAFADPGFDAERCLFIVSSSAPLGNSTEKQPQLRVVREMPAVETESGAHGNNKWARRMESLRVARAFNFSTLTVMDGDAFLCWSRWRAFTRLLASNAFAGGGAERPMRPLVAGFEWATTRAAKVQA